MLKIIRNLFQLIIDDIDSGNSNISENDLQRIIDFVRDIRSDALNKLEAAEYIKKSRATFDNYVNKGLIPKGKKRAGSNQLSWLKSDLDKFLNK